GAAVSNPSGSNSFAGPVTLTSSATISVVVGTLTLTGDTAGANDSILTKSGTGLLSMKNVRAGGLSIAAGSVQILPSGGAAPGVSIARSLSIPAGTKLDLTDNKLITSAAGGTLGTGNTYSGVTGLIQSGRGTGSWKGSARN